MKDNKYKNKINKQEELLSKYIEMTRNNQIEIQEPKKSVNEKQNTVESNGNMVGRIKE